MKIPMCLVLFTSLTVLRVQADDTAIHMRLQSLESNLNSRDFDLAVYKARKAEVVVQACEREKKLRRVPFACFELRQNTMSDGECQRLVGELSDEHLEATKQQNFAVLPSGCRKKLRHRISIAEYKQSGKHIE